MRILRILGVAVEITHYYYSFKKYGNYVLKGIQSFVTRERQRQEEPKNPVL